MIDQDVFHGSSSRIGQSGPIGGGCNVRFLVRLSQPGASEGGCGYSNKATIASMFSRPCLGNSRNICESKHQYSLTLSNLLPTWYVNLPAVPAYYLIHSFLRPISCQTCLRTVILILSPEKPLDTALIPMAHERGFWASSYGTDRIK